MYTEKIDKLVNSLKNITQKSNMTQKHAAMIMIGGKKISVGYNHDRMTTNSKPILSYHAEVHALANYINQNKLNSLKNFLNDTEKCLSFRKNKNLSGNVNQKCLKCIEKKLKLIVIRTDKDGKLKNSKPCNNCLQIMKLFGVNTVYYSNEDGNINKCKIDNICKDHSSGRQNAYFRFLKKNKNEFY